MAEPWRAARGNCSLDEYLDQDDEKYPSWKRRILYCIFTIIFIIGGMIALYFEPHRPKRLGLVVVFISLLVMLLLALRTRPFDIFVASVAYSAVLVVFLSGDLAGPQEVNLQLPNGGELAIETSQNPGVQSTRDNTINADTINDVTTLLLTPSTFSTIFVSPLPDSTTTVTAAAVMTVNSSAAGLSPNTTIPIYASAT
ncbi:hypothetical protein F5B20DRAFT_536715 [Whalleya microplaca]|nr:hypothetical protein F5B20DRAFT_536715 [Whalleya microplaca]